MVVALYEEIKFRKNFKNPPFSFFFFFFLKIPHRHTGILMSPGVGEKRNDCHSIVDPEKIKYRHIGYCFCRIVLFFNVDKKKIGFVR